MATWYARPVVLWYVLTNERSENLQAQANPSHRSEIESLTRGLSGVHSPTTTRMAMTRHVSVTWATLSSRTPSQHCKLPSEVRVVTHST